MVDGIGTAFNEAGSRFSNVSAWSGWRHVGQITGRSALMQTFAHFSRHSRWNSCLHPVRTPPVPAVASWQMAHSGSMPSPSLVSSWVCGSGGSPSPGSLEGRLPVAEAIHESEMLLIEVKRGGATMHARPERRAPDGSAEENNLLRGGDRGRRRDDVMRSLLQPGRRSLSRGDDRSRVQSNDLTPFCAYSRVIDLRYKARRVLTPHKDTSLISHTEYGDTRGSAVAK